MAHRDDRGLVHIDNGQPIVFAPPAEPELTPRADDVPDELLDTLAEFERFTVSRAHLSVQHTVGAICVTAERAALYEEFRGRIEQRVRERVAEQIEARRCGDAAPDVCAKCSCRIEDAAIARGVS